MSDRSRAELHLDVRGLACPLPVLKLRKALLGMTPGQRIRVEATDPVAAIDIPHFLSESGDRLISAVQEGGVGIYVVEKD